MQKFIASFNRFLHICIELLSYLVGLVIFCAFKWKWIAYTKLGIAANQSKLWNKSCDVGGRNERKIKAKKEMQTKIAVKQKEIT